MLSLQVLAAATASLGAASPLQLGAAWYIGKTVASMLSLQLVLAAASTNVTASLAIGAASPMPPIRAPGTPLCESVRTRAAAASHAAFKKHARWQLLHAYAARARPAPRRGPRGSS